MSTTPRSCFDDNNNARQCVCVNVCLADRVRVRVAMFALVNGSGS